MDFWGNLGFVLGLTLMMSTPLIFTALGATICENSGVVNIGLEGIMVAGAFTGAAVAYFTGNPWLGFAAAAVAGMLLASLHAVAAVSFGADHVISGIAINFLGPGIVLFISRALFQGATQTLTVPEKMPLWMEGLFPAQSFWDLVLKQYATVYLALFAVVLVWVFLYKTRFGLRLRAVGEHPKAAATLGIDVRRMKYAGVLLSGLLAGLGGAAMSIAVVSRFSPSLISGQGFIALAAMIFGKWKPQGAFLACLFFGFSKALEVFLGRPEFLGSPEWQFSSQLLAMLPYVLTLVILVGFVRKAVAPKALGQTVQ